MGGKSHKKPKFTKKNLNSQKKLIKRFIRRLK